MLAIAAERQSVSCVEVSDKRACKRERIAEIRGMARKPTLIRHAKDFQMYTKPYISRAKGVSCRLEKKITSGSIHSTCTSSQNATGVISALQQLPSWSPTGNSSWMGLDNCINSSSWYLCLGFCVVHLGVDRWRCLSCWRCRGSCFGFVTHVHHGVVAAADLMQGRPRHWQNTQRQILTVLLTYVTWRVSMVRVIAITAIKLPYWSYHKKLQFDCAYFECVSGKKWRTVREPNLRHWLKTGEDYQQGVVCFLILAAPLQLCTHSDQYLFLRAILK